MGGLVEKRILDMSFSSQKINMLLRWIAGFNFWVVAGIVLLGAVLGVLNNLRVYEEQRVEIFGEVPTAGAEEEDVDVGEGAQAPEQGEP